MPALFDSTSLYDDSSLSFDGFPAPLANMPSVGVFIAWDGLPYDVSPVWTDVTQYVRSINIRRGRSDDLQQFPPGTASLVLDNTQRLFDPFNTSGTWYSSLKPRKAIKIVANWNGVEYPLYRGYVAGWPVEYTEGGLDSTVTIDCFDILGLMGRELAATSYCEDYTLSLSPTVFIRMAQLSATYTDQTSAGNTRRYYDLDTVVNRSEWPAFQMSVLINTTTVGAQVGSVAPVNSNALGILTQGLQVSANAGIINSVGNPSATVGGGAFTWSAFISVSGAYTTYLSALDWSVSLAPKVRIYSPTNTSSPGYIEVLLFNTSGVSYAITTTKRIMDEAVHHLCLVVDPSVSTSYFYLDGELIGSQAYVGTLATSGFTQLGGGSIGASGSLTIQHFAYWQGSALSATQVAQIAKFGLNFDRQTAAARASFLLSQTNLNSGQYLVDTEATSVVAEYALGAAPILPELQRLAAGEDGELFVNTSGVLRLVDGNQYFNDSRSNTSQCTFTDTGTGVKYDASSIRIDLNADQVRNTVVVTASRDIQVKSESTTSNAEFGDASENVDTRLATAADAQTLADRVLTIYKNPKMTLEPFLVKGQANPSYNWPKLLALELLDRITFVRTPSVGSAITKDLLVQSVEHRITPNEWQTVVNGSARYTNWFIIGTSLIGGDDLLLN